MKNVLIVGLIVIGIGAGFAGGYYFKINKAQEPKTQVSEVRPSPTPDTDRFSNDKATVKSFDGRKLVYTLESGTEKTLADTTGIDVWQMPAKPEEKSVKTDWKIVKAGTKIVIASEKATGKVMAVLVL